MSPWFPVEPEETLVNFSTVSSVGRLGLPGKNVSELTLQAEHEGAVCDLSAAAVSFIACAGPGLDGAGPLVLFEAPMVTARTTVVIDGSRYLVGEAG